MAEWECQNSMLGQHVPMERFGASYCSKCGKLLDAEGGVQTSHTMRSHKQNQRLKEAAAGAKLRERALKEVTQNSNSEWRSAALNCLHALATGQPTLTADDVMVALEDLEVTTHETRAMGGVFRTAGWLEPTDRFVSHETRAMGAVFRTAQTQGWIEPTDRFVSSTRAKAHRGPKRPKRVWRSRITDQSSMALQ